MTGRGRWVGSRRPAVMIGITLGCAMAVSLSPSGAASQAEGARHAFESEHMGTTFRIVAYAADADEATVAARAAFALVDRLDSLFSDYRSDSEVSRLAARAGDGSFVPVSPELWTLLESAQGWARRTGGAFDVTVGPLSRLWRWSARRGRLPTADRLEAARAAVGFGDLALDARGRGVRLFGEHMSLDLGGIAKGYAADAALAELSGRGIEAALVDAGGDLSIGEAPPGEAGWRVALPGGEVVSLARGGVATSGDASRHLVVDGVRYSHVVDSRTGLGVTDAPTVTVVGPDATTADVLASALTVMDRAAGESLVRSLDAVWVRVDGAERWTAGPRPTLTPTTEGKHR